MTKDQSDFQEHLRQLRNVLAVIRSIVRRTGEHSLDAGLFASRITGRLDAYSWIVSELTRGAKVGLAMIVAEQLLVYGAHEGDSLSITGPDIHLTGKVAESLGMAIHELAFNAMEHGALNWDDAKIAVSWMVTGARDVQVLDFTWAETNLGAPPAIYHQGFGVDHLLRTLPYETRGRAESHIDPTSLTWNIQIPLPHL